MKIGFWLLVNGEKQAAMKAPKEAQKLQIAVGPKKPQPDAFAIIKRSEIDDYLTHEFERQYKIFERFEMGFGMPRGLTWDQQPVFIMDILETFKAEYDRYKRLYGVS